MDMGWLCLIPPIIAVGFSLWTRQVIPALFIALWVATTMVKGWNPWFGFVDAMERIASVFTTSTRYNILNFALIGMFTTLLHGAGAFAILAETIAKIGVSSKRAVQSLVCSIGTALFMTSSVSVLTTGAVTKPLADKYKVSSEKLSFLLDATGAPVCSLTLIGPWGALLMGLLEAQGVSNDAAVAFGSIPFNFYAIAMYLLMWYTVVRGKDYGPMGLAEERAILTGKLIREDAKVVYSDEPLSAPKKGTNIITAVLPIVVLVATVFFFLWWTGKGDILKGSGGKAFAYACAVSVLVTIALLFIQRITNLTEVSDNIMKGAAKMMPIMLIIVLAIALSTVVKDMKTGQYLAQFTKTFLSPVLLPAILFVLSCVMSFATGTSYGTMGIMIPIGIPMAVTLGIGFPLVTGAILAGAVFGDHCSPISDTTIISSMAAGADHIDHVTTQMYYAFIAAGAALGGFLVLGFIL